MIHHDHCKLTRHSSLSPCLEQGPRRRTETSFDAKACLAIRVRLEIAENHRDLAQFNLAIDSKLRGCDLVKLKVAGIYASGQVKERASIIQSKTQRPVRFEITEGTRKSILRWMEEPLMIGSDFLWPGRFHERLYISTRQYARLVREWVKSIGLDPTSFGMHSMRRTKVAHIYRKTGNLRAVQLLLGHTKMDSTVRYLGVEHEDAPAISEAVEIERLGPFSSAVQGRPSFHLHDSAVAARIPAIRCE
ncbi:tyrosine-type recombinase/integrase [Ruegeria pomeroyi]|uniref:Tyrosine-type recombinase/integrase n=1 Tax=Ruegeria pomeroyi TaxID=89184 RepID=A0A850LM10_9RHOB|nr:tyrosine-type recombinase/integrase [Ruegeria pomeroyi]NVL02370.1 tyrosine-type recombinase/integrase [Ruegeria pomeroyi]QWV07527.1 tyrosine-type recombinase/integrase [Ruegeria pomeroyi]HCE71554.1 integrase [Ruegeria sp.]